MSTSDTAADFGEHAARIELARCLDVCLDCRRCVDLCGVFSEAIDLVGSLGHAESGLLTPLEQDRILSLCSHCDQCRDDCPHRPGVGEAAVDLPAAVEGVAAAVHRSGRTGWRSAFVVRALASDGAMRWARRFRGPLNRLLRGREGGVSRRALSMLIGVTSDRPVPRIADQSFTDWFSLREPAIAAVAPSVLVVPTCLIDQFAPEIGQATVTTLEGCGVRCVPSGVICCGGGLLESGQVDRFLRVAETNLALLSEGDCADPIVVLQPGCAEVLRSDYPREFGQRAAAVASRVRGAFEHLDARSSMEAPGDGASLPDVVGVISSPRAAATGEEDLLIARLEGRGVRVVRIPSGPVGESSAALLSTRDTAESAPGPAEVADDVPLVGLSVLVNGALERRLGRAVEPAQNLLPALFPAVADP